MQGETYTRQLEKLKGDVKIMLGQVGEPLHQLELIDTLQRLGIHYHFGEEIKRILHSIYNNYNRNDTWKNGDLYATALEFRLLRQHGYHVPQGIRNYRVLGLNLVFTTVLIIFSGSGKRYTIYQVKQHI